MTKQNITHRSTGELSLLVFNDEELYNQRHEYDFIELLLALYTFTPAQLKVLRHDLAEDLIEIRESEASIIAAAPEMLEALEAIQDHLTFADSYEQDELLRIACKLRDLSRRAISKAKGQNK